MWRDEQQVACARMFAADTKAGFWVMPAAQSTLCPALRLALVLMVTAALGACAIGNFGTLAARVERSGNMATVDMYSAGLHLRMRADDSGAHLGYSHRRYVFVSTGQLEPGWYIFRAPLPDREAMAQDLMTVGIELSTVAPTAGITLGYSHDTIRARVAVEESLYIQYDLDNTRVVKVDYCQEGGPCEIALPSH